MRPAWLEADLYPFAPQRFESDGHGLHYVDEGEGEPVVFVHGTPTWSFLWRAQLAGLRGSHRVVAGDHLGFGLSDKPADADYSPAAHARRLGALIEHLGLRDITLVVHDYGGPIGLAHAVQRPERVSRLVVLNSWLWSNAGDRAVESASRLLGGPFGRLLYRRLNLSPRVLLPAAFADRTKLTPEVHRHYLAPFPGPEQRQAPWVLARELMGSNAWYDELWQRRAALRDKPALLIWGLRDRLMPPRHLARWQSALPGAEVLGLEDVGHFPQEEAPQAVTRRLSEFLTQTAARP